MSKIEKLVEDLSALTVLEAADLATLLPLRLLLVVPRLLSRPSSPSS